MFPAIGSYVEVSAGEEYGVGVTISFMERFIGY